MAVPVHERFSCGTTTKMFPTLEYSWTINNISRYGTVEGYPLLHSPTFIAPPAKITTKDKKPVQFQLRFEPNGRHFKRNSVFISMVNPSCSFNILHTFSVVKANGEKHIVASEMDKLMLLESMAMFYAYHEMRRDELYNPANGFVSNDSITLHCEVVILLTETVKSDQYDQLVKSYGNLLESGPHSDVTFVLDDGQELRAHKNILAARSQVFADMCEFSTADSSNDRVNIVETRVEVFKQMLHFIYTGQVGTSLDGIAQDLLVCADKYQLDSLKSICEDCLVTSITVESDLIELHELAKRINAPKLQAKVVDLLRNDVDGLITKVFQLKRQLSTLEAVNSNTNKKSKKSY